MSAILKIPEVRRRVSPLSVEEYHRLDESNERGRRTELRGIVIAGRSRDATRKHACSDRAIRSNVSACQASGSTFQPCSAEH
ncbi:MAG TPA: hypothetical protein VFR76_12670 [Verrucomicrobiae bacterium]|nr:hypothetical protein [Verrucomicrobiae bacterium]